MIFIRQVMISGLAEYFKPLKPKKMSKPINTLPREKLKLYDKLISTLTSVTRKGKTMPYTSHNGHMFSFLDKEGNMGLRLSKDDREAFIQEYDTKLMEQYGKVMKEYVKVPDHLLNNTETLSEYLQKSFEYIKTLKPKPGNKK